MEELYGRRLVRVSSLLSRTSCLVYGFDLNHNLPRVCPLVSDAWSVLKGTDFIQINKDYTPIPGGCQDFRDGTCTVKSCVETAILECAENPTLDPVAFVITGNYGGEIPSWINPITGEEIPE